MITHGAPELSTPHPVAVQPHQNQLVVAHLRRVAACCLRRCKKILKTKGWPDPESNSPWAKDVSAWFGCCRVGAPPTASHPAGRGMVLWQHMLRLWTYTEIALLLQVAAIEGEILLVSQFTLYGRLKKPKPDYSKAMGPDQVRACWDNKSVCLAVEAHSHNCCSLAI